MELLKDHSLQNNNSFNIICNSPKTFILKSINDLHNLPDLSLEPFYILGDGTNTLFVDDKSPLIIKPSFKGINFSETENHFKVSVAAGENWHEFVTLCIEKGINGLENLALIPGSVGAAPVQNIGAYGVEVSDFCIQVKWFDFDTQTIKALSSDDCNFSYRNSIFKQELYNKGIITEVIFEFPKNWKPNLLYAGLDTLSKNCTASSIMKKVISLRKGKLPDPKKTPNAGSFFKNPLVKESKLHELTLIYSSIPFYCQKNGDIKLAAGWLIDQAGLKGLEMKGVGIHNKQALVIVNKDNNKGTNIVALAQLVQKTVFEKFNVMLEPEVRIVTSHGEKSFSELSLQVESQSNG